MQVTSFRVTACYGEGETMIRTEKDFQSQVSAMEEANKMLRNAARVTIKPIVTNIDKWRVESLLVNSFGQVTDEGTAKIFGTFEEARNCLNETRFESLRPGYKWYYTIQKI